MPVYEYKDTTTGEIFECLVPVHDRDKPCRPGIVRISVPRRLNVVGLTPAPTAESEAIAGFKRLEDDTDTARQFERESGFSMREAARIWKTEEPNPQPIAV